MTVYRLSTFRPAHVLSDHRRLGALCGPPLIPQQDGAIERFIAVAGKCAACLRARTLGPVHVARQADHDTLDRALRYDRAQHSLVARPFAAAQCLAIGRKTPAGIASGRTDCLGAQIQSEQCAAIGQRSSEIDRAVGNQFACSMARTRVFTSACVFAQKSGMS